MLLQSFKTQSFAKLSHRKKATNTLPTGKGEHRIYKPLRTEHFKGRYMISFRVILHKLEGSVSIPLVLLAQPRRPSLIWLAFYKFSFAVSVHPPGFLVVP